MTPSTDANFATGAVRSADANHLDFASLPLVGLVAVARTAAEGGDKYGRHNYMLGMPAHDQINHAIRHAVLWLLGDRSEPHLEHGAWGFLAAIQSATLDPDINAPHLLGPGATLTAAMRQHLAENAPILAARRKDAPPKTWKLADLPEIRAVLERRKSAQDPALNPPSDRASLKLSLRHDLAVAGITDRDIVFDVDRGPGHTRSRFEEVAAKQGVPLGGDLIDTIPLVGEPRREPKAAPLPCEECFAAGACIKGEDSCLSC